MTDFAAELAQARAAVAEAIAADTAAGRTWPEARRVLARHGAAALGIDAAAAPPLAQQISLLAAPPQSLSRRVFAVLVVDALAVPGLLPATPSPARQERAVCALLESALPHALHRAGYPFGADRDERRRFLPRLPAMIDELLRPLEPTFPPWLNGLPQR